MDRIFINVYVSPAEAVRSGVVYSGTQRYEPDADELDALDAAALDELARLANREPHHTDIGRLPGEQLGEVSWDRVVELLKARAAQRVEDRAAQALKEAEIAERIQRAREHVDALFENDVEALLRRNAFGGWEPALRPVVYSFNLIDLPKQFRGDLDRLHGICRKRNAELDEKQKNAQERLARQRAEAAATQRAALEAFVKECMGSNAQGRLAARKLPIDEVKLAIRDQTFKEVDAPRYDRIKASEVQHDYDCEGSIDVETSEAEVLTATQWQALKQIEEQAPQGSTVCVIEHVATCDGCEARLVRFGIKVTVDWHGITLSREYAIEGAD